MKNRFSILAGALLLSAGLGSCVTPPPPPADRLVVSASRVPLYPGKPNETRAGKLVYRGGLELTSNDKRFGGWSDLTIAADGTDILSIADEAHWLRTKLTYDENGNLSGITSPQIEDMRGLSGEIMQGKDGDAEGMTTLPDGSVLVSFERDHRVWRYDLRKGLKATPTNVPLGDWIKKLPANEGLEGITLLPGNRLLALSEHGVDENDGIIGGIEGLGPDAKDTGPLSVHRHGPYYLTGANTDAKGALYILERRFSITGGVGMSVRRFAKDEVKPGARMEGEILADLSYQDATIDNMEGIAIRTGAKGETLLYILADDNYSPLERTLLLMFEVQ